METLIRWKKKGEGDIEGTDPDGFLEFHCEVVSKKVVGSQVAGRQ